MRRGNGEGSVFKLGGRRRKPWAVRITVGYTSEGKQQYKYLGYYPTKKEAKEALNLYLVDPYNLEYKDISLLQVYEMWVKTSDLSANTMRNYICGFKRCQSIHKKPIRELRAIHIETVMQEYKPSIQMQIKNVLNKVFIFAEKNEIINKNIMPLVKAEPRETPKEKIPFTLEQARDLLNYKNHIFADTINILFYTGMRITELFDIKTENVFLEERYMIGGKKTKAGTNRIIPIHDEIYDIIKKRYERGHKYLVTSATGKQLLYSTYLKSFWYDLKEMKGFTQTPHDIRHTFVTFASRQGLDRLAVQKIIGHKGIDVTDRYDYRDKEELLAEINKLKY